MLSIALPVRYPSSAHRRRSALRALTRAIVGADVRPWNVAVLFALSALVVARLALANVNATAGYELRTLERRLDAFREEARRFELLALEAQSVGALDERLVREGYIPVARVEYLTPDRAVVQR